MTNTTLAAEIIRTYRILDLANKASSVLFTFRVGSPVQKVYQKREEFLTSI